MSKKRKRGKFGANVVADVSHQQRKGKGPSYLNLPKDIKLFKESVGRVKLDILPYTVSLENHLDYNKDDPDSAHVGNLWYKKPILIHRGIGPERNSYVCPKCMGKTKCPICEERSRQFSEGASAEEVPGKIGKRNLYAVIPIGHKDYEEEVHVWDIAQGNFQEELNKDLEETPENGVFPDLEDGLTLSIRFSEETFDKNKYAKASRFDFKERDEPYDESILEEVPDLDSLINVLSYKELEAAFLELDEEDEEEDEDEEDEEEAPRKSRKRKGSKTKPEPEEDEEEEDEEEKPKRSRRTRGVKKSSKKSEKECPEGYSFGTDWDEYDECDECPLNDICGDKAEELQN